MTVDAQILSTLPTEILLYIFTLLPARELMKCRQVCQRWKQIVDGLMRSDALWRRHCQHDYTDVFKVARQNSRPGLLWYNIYRSLALWSRLESARELRDEFASASSVNDEVHGFKILRDGIIGVHKRTAIVYYDLETLELSKRTPITGDYLKYTENNDTIIIHGKQLHLFVVKKGSANRFHETNISFENVKLFLVVDNILYYVTLNDEIYKCCLDESNLRSTFIKRHDEPIMALGYTNTLHILTFDRDIYSMERQNLVHAAHMGADSNLLDVLHQYNFLDNLHWRIYYQWMLILHQHIPEGPLRDIATVYAYGDVIFVGTRWGVLRIYHAPFTNGKFNIFNADPVKQYNFMERADCPVLSMCPILQIDVLEAIDGHTVIVAMPKKLAILDFIHNFKRSASCAMLPYRDIQKVKILRIDEGTA